MTTGGNSSDGPMGDPYGSGPGSQGHGQGYGQSAYGGQPYGNDPYGGQPYGEPFPQPGADNGPGRSGPIDATDAISAGWSLFKNNPLPWVLISLITLVISGLVGALGVTDSAAMATFANLLSIVVGLVLQAFMLRGALLEVDGYKPALGDFFRLHNFGWFVVAAIIVGILTTLGLVVVIIGAFVVGFFLYWTLYFVVDRNMNAMNAITSSFNAIKSDAGNLFVLAILNTLITIVGFLLVFVGLLAAMPIVMLASMVAYRSVTGPSDFSRQASVAA